MYQYRPLLDVTTATKPVAQLPVAVEEHTPLVTVWPVGQLLRVWQQDLQLEEQAQFQEYVEDMDWVPPQFIVLFVQIYAFVAP